MHGATDLDFGTYGRTCLKAAAIAGFCQEDVWPYSEDPIVVRKKPPWNAYRAGVDQNDLGFYRILGDADERLLQFKRAIAAGNPVIFGTDVAEEFTSFVGKKVFGPPSGNIAGGHMMCAIAYEPDDVIALSSWGENSHDGGLHHFTEDVIRWSRTRDIWAIRAAREMLTR